MLSKVISTIEMLRNKVDDKLAYFCFQQIQVLLNPFPQKRAPFLSFLIKSFFIHYVSKAFVVVIVIVVFICTACALQYPFSGTSITLFYFSGNQIQKAGNLKSKALPTVTQRAFHGAYVPEAHPQRLGLRSLSHLYGVLGLCVSKCSPSLLDVLGSCCC